MKSVKKVLSFFSEVWAEVQKHDLSDAAAALSFHTILALVPSLTLLIVILGKVWGRETIEDFFYSAMEGTFGTEITVLERAVEGAIGLMSGLLFSVVILIVALWASVSLVHHAKKTFFTLFNVRVLANGGLARTVKSRMLSLGYTALLFVLIVTLVIGQGVAAYMFNVIRGVTGGVMPNLMLEGVNVILMFAVIFVLFSALFRLMSAGSLGWRPVAWGSVLSATLFTVFNLFISIYTTYSIELGLFGASGFILVILVWVYYSAFSLFLGGVVAVIVDRRIRRKKGRPVYI